MAAEQMRLPFVDYVAEIVGAVLESPRAAQPLEELIDRRLRLYEPRLADLFEARLRKVLDEREDEAGLLTREEAARYLRTSVRNFERWVAEVGEALAPESRGPRGQTLWRRGKLAAWKSTQG